MSKYVCFQRILPERQELRVASVDQRLVGFFGRFFQVNNLKQSINNQIRLISSFQAYVVSRLLPHMLQLERLRLHAFADQTKCNELFSCVLMIHSIIAITNFCLNYLKISRKLRTLIERNSVFRLFVCLNLHLKSIVKVQYKHNDANLIRFSKGGLK